MVIAQEANEGLGPWACFQCLEGHVDNVPELLRWAAAPNRAGECTIGPRYNVKVPTAYRSSSVAVRWIVVLRDNTEYGVLCSART